MFYGGDNYSDAGVRIGRDAHALATLQMLCEPALPEPVPSNPSQKVRFFAGQPCSGEAAIRLV